MSAPPEPVRLDSAQGRWLVLATVLGSGVVFLDGTVVNVALVAIGRDLDSGFAGLQWTLNAYTLTLAAFILLGGSLGDRLGRRRMFVAGTVWFAVASLLCAVAPDVRILVAARALQGIGGALLTPGSLAIIAATLDPQDRARAIGLWSGLAGIAGAVGPFVGGWLLEVASWRWVFLINLPLAAVVVLVAVRHVPETRDPQPARLDLPGAVLGASGLGALTYALIAGGEGVSTSVLVAAAAGVAALVAFVAVERVSSHPMVPLTMFADRQFSAVNVVTFVVYGAMGGLFFLLVLQLQVVSGFSPLAAGTALLPITVLLLLLSARSGALAQRIGPRWPMTVGSVVCAAGVLAMTSIGPGAGYWRLVLPVVTLFGLGLTLIVAPLTAAVLASADQRRAGIASGINNAVARAAGLVAVAVLPVLAGLQGSDYQRPEVFDAAFHVVVYLCAGLLLLGGVLSALFVGRVVPGDDDHASQLR